MGVDGRNRDRMARKKRPPKRQKSILEPSAAALGVTPADSVLWFMEVVEEVSEVL